MATHAQLAARLLRDAAEFFGHLAKDNPDLADAMQENADIFTQIAHLVETDPLGEANVQEQANDE